MTGAFLILRGSPEGPVFVGVYDTREEADRVCAAINADIVADERSWRVEDALAHPDREWAQTEAAKTDEELLKWHGVHVAQRAINTNNHYWRETDHDPQD